MSGTPPPLIYVALFGVAGAVAGRLLLYGPRNRKATFALALCGLATVYVAVSAGRWLQRTPHQRTLVFTSKHTSFHRGGISHYLHGSDGSSWETSNHSFFDYARPGLVYRCSVVAGPLLFFADTVTACSPVREQTVPGAGSVS